MSDKKEKTAQQSNTDDQAADYGSQTAPKRDGKEKPADSKHPHNETGGGVAGDLKALKDRVRITDVLMVLATIVIAAATVFNVVVVKGQLDEMRSSGAQANQLIGANVQLATAATNSASTADKNLIATQRAWVGTIDANVTQGQPFTVVKGTILYINSGREPAKFNIGGSEYLYTREAWINTTAATDIISRQTECLKSPVAGARVAWPTTGFSNYFAHVPDGVIPNKGVVTWSDRINKGEDVVVIQGCIAYTAFDVLHHTSFCYFYDQKLPSDMTHLNICTVGNDVN